MKCIVVILILSVGLQTLRAEDEVTDATVDSTELPSIIDEEDGSGNATDSGKSYDELPNDLEARLPSDYHSIRTNIIDTKFDCADHEPGYYADVENECQIFHRCLEGRSEVFSFICPGETVFSQQNLVCAWHKSVNCAESESFYEESNRAFSGNMTAQSNINENIKNSTEITDMEIDEVEDDDMDAEDESRKTAMSEDLKLMGIPENQKLEVVNENSEMLEKNSIEEKVESVSVEQQTEESNEFQAELIPSAIDAIDASIASASDAISASHPQKIMISVLDPIIEMPLRDEAKDEDQLQISESSRHFRRRSGPHNSRFLFKADAH